MIRNDKILYVFIEGKRSHCVLKAFARAQQGLAAPCGSGSWGPGMPARLRGRGFARQGAAGVAARTARARVIRQVPGYPRQG